jgi:hypothetical protein
MLEKEQTLFFSCCSGRDAVPPAESPAVIQADQAYQVSKPHSTPARIVVKLLFHLSCLTRFEWAASDGDKELIVSSR